MSRDDLINDLWWYFMIALFVTVLGMVAKNIAESPY